MVRSRGRALRHHRIRGRSAGAMGRRVRAAAPRSPADVPAQHWRQFVDDCGRFLNGGFAATAAALGWGAFDLFGCDRDRPLACTNQRGLLWRLNGDQLIVLTAETATAETLTGTRQTYRRKPAAPGAVSPAAGPGASGVERPQNGGEAPEPAHPLSGEALPAISPRARDDRCLRRREARLLARRATSVTLAPAPYSRRQPPVSVLPTSAATVPGR